MRSKCTIPYIIMNDKSNITEVKDELEMQLIKLEIKRLIQKANKILEKNEL